MLQALATTPPGDDEALRRMDLRGGAGPGAWFEARLLALALARTARDH